MSNKASTKRARSPTPRPPEAPPGWSSRWRVYPSAAAATKHAIRHRVVSQIVLPEVAGFMPVGCVLLRDHCDEVCCVDYVQVKVRHTYMDDSPTLTLADIAHLQVFPYLVRLSFIRTRVNEECLRLVAKLTSLQTLDLSSCSFDAAGLAALAELPGLDWLELGECYYSMDAECLVQVAKLSTLRYLGLSTDYRVGAAALAEVAKLTELRHLDISRCYVDAAALTEVAKLSQLQRINLDYCREVDAAAIAELAKLPHLVHICVAGCKVSAAEVALLLPKCAVGRIPIVDIMNGFAEAAGTQSCPLSQSTLCASAPDDLLTYRLTMFQ